MFKPAVRLCLAAALIIIMARPAAGEPIVPPEKKRNEIRVTFVNVGAGLCTVIECPNGEPPILYDCGSSGVGDTGMKRSLAIAYVRKILVRYYPLRPRVIVSHPDGDHYNYISEIIGNTPAASIWLGG
jgi:beta-lactamase superfamily II metal-dependent hydrolase